MTPIIQSIIFIIPVHCFPIKPRADCTIERPRQRSPHPSWLTNHLFSLEVKQRRREARYTQHLCARTASVCVCAMQCNNTIYDAFSAFFLAELKITTPRFASSGASCKLNAINHCLCAARAGASLSLLGIGARCSVRAFTQE
jgi:hypothetical protein